MIPNNKRSTTERRALILKKLDTDGQVDVKSLSDDLKVSDVTIRNDLNKLEKKDILIRTRGGAIKTDRVAKDFKVADKNSLYFQEKQLIGKAASFLIEEGDTILLDSGSTTMEITKHFSRFKNLTIISNAINVAVALAEMENISLIVPGGIFRRNSLSLVGSAAEENLDNYFCDKLFLAVDGIDLVHGLSTPNVEEAQLNKKMIEISKKVIVVTDSSKFNRRSMATIGPLSKVDTVITDSQISKKELDSLVDMGINVIIA